jgi:hypothetical protein
MGIGQANRRSNRRSGQGWCEKLRGSGEKRGEVSRERNEVRVVSKTMMDHPDEMIIETIIISSVTFC